MIECKESPQHLGCLIDFVYSSWVQERTLNELYNSLVVPFRVIPTDRDLAVSYDREQHMTNPGIVDHLLKVFIIDLQSSS